MTVNRGVVRWLERWCENHPKLAERITKMLAPDPRLDQHGIPVGDYRCPWVQRLTRSQCARWAGHDGPCITRYADGSERMWNGINYTAPDPL